MSESHPNFVQTKDAAQIAVIRGVLLWELLVLSLAVAATHITFASF